ncbi:response regulator transcription factor [Paenibacillus physcomitrellae]|uniref:response regulator transcription factor n=1 Tax=Paenibacillus physcomitrellae TaxID=1619311 RepID=UPI000B8D12AE|nr:response regulator transcription factor [Paenibacillus physcomitrellae]
MKRKVLLVEDDALMREFITDYFKKEDWDVYEAENGVAALQLFAETKMDLVILDIMMPELDGWSTCREIRRESNVPIIMITARTEDDDQLLGFELGADEYVTKPLSPRVLVARAAALMKRAEGSGQNQGDLFVQGRLSVNKQSHVVTVAGNKVNLTPKEYDLLLFLISHYGKVMPREYILDSVWGYDYFGDLRTVDTHIKKLRAKLGEEGRYIGTVIRSGYKFEGDL